MQLERLDSLLAHDPSDAVVFHHNGRLNEEMVASIGALLRRRLREAGASSDQSRKVFKTFMEMAQNILHYAARDEQEGHPDRSGVLSVARSPEGFVVMGGNFVVSAQVARIRGRLEAVQVMGPEKVRMAYRRQLAFEGQDPDSKGAGLGLLTVAASARKPIEFTFDPDTPCGSGQSFLFLKAII